jgi:hypothetical protein
MGFAALGGSEPSCQLQTPLIRQNGAVAVLEDCRHYVMQTTAREDKLERCRMGANEQLPFACPEGCLFYEPRRVSGAGWTIRTTDDS